TRRRASHGCPGWTQARTRRQGSSGFSLIRDHLGHLWPLPVLLLGLAGCLNPFASDPSDYGHRIPEDRFRNLERLKVENYANPPTPTPTAEEAEAIVKKRFDRDRFASIAKLKLSIEEARASALANNLDIKVVLEDPSIAGQTLRAEEAKFEAVFTPRVT